MAAGIDNFCFNLLDLTPNGYKNNRICILNKREFESKIELYSGSPKSGLSSIIKDESDSETDTKTDSKTETTDTLPETTGEESKSYIKKKLTKKEGKKYIIKDETLEKEKSIEISESDKSEPVKEELKDIKQSIEIKESSEDIDEKSEEKTDIKLVLEKSREEMMEELKNSMKKLKLKEKFNGKSQLFFFDKEYNFIEEENLFDVENMNKDIFIMIYNNPNRGISPDDSGYVNMTFPLTLNSAGRVDAESFISTVSSTFSGMIPNESLQSLLGQLGNLVNDDPDSDEDEYIIHTFELGSNGNPTGGGGVPPDSTGTTTTTTPETSTSSSGGRSEISSLISSLTELIRNGGGGGGGYIQGSDRSEVIRDGRERYGEQIELLNAMGFSDEYRNIEALIVSGGNVEAAVNYLMN